MKNVQWAKQHPWILAAGGVAAAIVVTKSLNRGPVPLFAQPGPVLPAAERWTPTLGQPVMVVLDVMKDSLFGPISMDRTLTQGVVSALSGGGGFFVTMPERVAYDGGTLAIRGRDEPLDWRYILRAKVLDF